ncbi:hypothetical protein LXA43DRAFT_1092442 [Ganoderma leucocontextum]|nr:hypothetical protein LXA43DRAFT_1092442 [Ganoderma leucocontextum]
MYALAVLSVAVLVGQTVATPVAAAAPLVAIFKRQGGTTLDPGSIPAQCESQCGSAINAMNTCADINCLCSDTVNKGIYSCFECALSLQPDASLMSQAQTTLTQFENTCSQAGVALTPLTLTMPSGSAATSSGSFGSPSTAGSNPSAGSNPTGPATIPAGTAITPLPAPTNPVTSAPPAATNSPSPGSNPLPRNGAGMVGVSVASVAGAVGVAIAALF